MKKSRMSLVTFSFKQFGFVSDCIGFMKHKNHWESKLTPNKTIRRFTWVNSIKVERRFHVMMHERILALIDGQLSQILSFLLVSTTYLNIIWSLKSCCVKSLVHVAIKRLNSFSLSWLVAFRCEVRKEIPSMFWCLVVLRSRNKR